MPFSISLPARWLERIRPLAAALAVPALCVGLAVAAPFLPDPDTPADSALSGGLPIDGLDGAITDSLTQSMWGASPLGKMELRFAELFVATRPVQATMLGLHEGDGQLGPAGVAGTAFRAAAWHAFTDSLATLSPTLLSADDRLDVGLMLHEARYRLFLLETCPLSARDPGWAVRELAGGMIGLLIRDHAPLSQRVASLIGRLHEAPDFLAGAAELIENPPRRLVEQAIAECDAVTGYLLDAVPQATADLSDPAAIEALDAAVQIALQAVWRYRLTLEEEELPSAAFDPALGEARFLAWLKASEGIETNLDHLRAQIQAEIARLEEGFIAAAQAIDSSATPGEVMRSVGQAHPPVDSILAVVGEALEEARTFFGNDPDLPAVPTPVVRVAPSPRFTQSVHASLVTAGPFETKAFTPVAYVTLPQRGVPAREREQQLRFFNRALLANLAIHEGFPGHAYQGEIRRQLQRPARRLVTSAAFVEGWAHYAESYALERGFRADDPEFVLATLQSALRRAGRFRVALGLHTEGWTEAQAAAFLESSCYLEPWVAGREAARGLVDPMYLGYTLGRMELDALRREYVEEGALSLRAFHSRVLSTGAPPFPLLRERLAAGDPPPRGYLD